MTLWLAVIAAGMATVCIRLSFLVFVHHGTLPRMLHDALRYVTAAALAAIIVPAVLFVGENDDFSAGPGNARLLAALLAVAVAWATRSVWLTIALGMGALWLFEGLL